MRPQDGKGLIGLLFAMLILIGVAWLAVPWLQRSGMSADEASAVASLRSIHQAQQNSLGGNQMYDSIRKLREAGYLGPEFANDDFKHRGYEFYHNVSGSRRTWCAVAVPQMGEHATAIGTPQRAAGKVFGIDETGVVMQDVSPSACYAGTLNTAGGSPVR